MKKLIPGDITVVIPAYNEEHNLQAAVGSVVQAMRGFRERYVILIINDGSMDGTAAIARQLARKNNRIRVMHNERNQGLGYSFRSALEQITSAYVTIFPGDNDMSATSLTDLVQERESADMIIGYMRNTHSRGWGRRLLSRLYVVGMNLLFGLRLRYYNGPFLCNTARLRALPLRSNGLDIFAETKVRMIRSGCSVREIPFDHTGRKHGVSKAVTGKSFMQTTRTAVLLTWDIYR